MKVLFLIAIAATTLLAAERGSYPPPQLGDTSSLGRNIQRTMRLLAESTPEHRNTVRILFYGQSITEQKWAAIVTDDLRSRFPNANLIVENRALGGFASQLLVKTAETDLYPFYPDLLIFHVYGAHNSYEDIIRRTRESTTAEILQQTDHITKPADLTEETDPAKLPPAGKHWDAFMNHNWLPTVATKYGTELCDQRSFWKTYLSQNALEPKQLLRDGVHLNPQGEYLMAEIVKAYLRYDPRLGPSSAEKWVKTLRAEDLKWSDGTLRVEFDGNRIDVIAKPATPVTGAVRIDGRKPSEIPELYGFTRALSKPGGKWPVVAPIRYEKPLQVEDWTLEAKRISDATNQFEFVVRGSRTGDDGAGRTDRRFVSRSGRIVIETNAWNISYAMSLAGVKPVPDQFTVKWVVIPHFIDSLSIPASKNVSVENAATIAQGLTNTRHVLELKCPNQEAIAAVRIYSPPEK